jgi:opacity protein-like surface antigen
MNIKNTKMGLIATVITLSTFTFQSSFAGRFFVGAAIGLKQTSTEFNLDKKSVGTAKLEELLTEELTLLTQVAGYRDEIQNYKQAFASADSLINMLTYLKDVDPSNEKEILFYEELLEVEKKKIRLSTTEIPRINRLIDETNKEISTIQAQKAEYDKILNFIQLDTTTQKRTSTSLYALAGYRLKLQNMVLMTEIGLNHLPLNIISDGNGNGIEVKKTLSLHVNQKIGYTFVKNNITYLMAGIGYNKMEFIYTDVEDDKDGVLSLIMGIGHEYAINENFAIFGEYTVERYKDRSVFSNVQIGHVKVLSQELKFGFRYYF